MTLPGDDVRPLRFADLMAVERVDAPAVSPDGQRVAYVLATHDPVKNEVRRTIRVVELESNRGEIWTPGPGTHSSPAWSPDGRWLAFVSDRDAEQGSQLWILPTAGGEARRVTSGYGGVSQIVWAPDSRRMAFARSVVVSAEYTPPEGEEVDPKSGPPRAQVFGLVNEKSAARVEDALLFRHWDHWRERRRSHVFIVDIEDGEPVDLTPGDWDAPPISLGSAQDIAFAPDGAALAFVANPDEVVARSTNNCIFVQGLDGKHPDGEPRCVSNTGASDCHPRFSAAGQVLFYLGMDEPGYEADHTRLRAVEVATGDTRTYLEDFQRSPHAFEIEPDGGSIIFVAQDRGRQSLYRLELADGTVRQLTLGTFNGPLCLLPEEHWMLVGRQSTTAPLDLYLLEVGEGIQPFTDSGPAPSDLPPDAGAIANRVTFHGDAVGDITLHPAREFWYKGAEGTPLHGFLVPPPDFDETKKYPLILLIHGGPQGAFGDDFHYRWSTQLFAAQGAVVAFVNPRGSTGYGHALKEQISQDWGGRCYEDILRCVDHLPQAFPFVDAERFAAAGASYGGFMVNWIAGHSDRFRALVCHDGIFHAETMAYTTEELWFEEKEHGGLPHVSREKLLEFSPHLHVESFSTPTLVVHGEKDFRCPISEGLGMYTALQTMGVPSRLLVFPDEGHWVVQPANAEVWYHEVVGWLMRWLRQPGTPMGAGQ